MCARVVLTLWVVLAALEAVSCQIDFNKVGGGEAAMAMVPDNCKPTIETAKKEGKKAYDWIMNHPCKKCKAPTKAILKHEPWIKEFLTYILIQINKKGIKLTELGPGLTVPEIMKLYEEYKKDCVYTDKTFMNHPNLCKARNDEFKGIQECCKAKFSPSIPKYMANAIPFMMDNCPKGKPILEYFLIGEKKNRKQDGKHNVYAKLEGFMKKCP